MDRFASEARRLVEAAALGLLATAPLYLAPASIAERLDAWVYDVWSRTAPAAASPSLAIGIAETPQAMSELASAATRAGVELIVLTLPTAVPSPQSLVIGPADIPTGAVHSRTTDWRTGRVALFAPELDGVVRRDGFAPTSLPSIAATRLGAATLPARPLLRLAAPDTLRKWDVTSDASGLRALVVGVPGSSLVTPVGVVTTPELVALAIDAHLSRSYLTESRVAALAMWLAALAFAIGANLHAPRFSRALAWTLAGGLVLVTTSTVTFAHSDLWAPITGPLAWLALTNVLATVRRPVSPAAQPASSTIEAGDIVQARSAAANGQAREAWNLYRSVPATSELLPELYELGCALQARGAEDEAAELFHRIAQTDSGFRDVARRLVDRRGPKETADEAPPLPQTIGRYELLGHIGRGAMGDVYLSRDPIINRLLALKAIDLSIGYEHEGMESASESFLREATIAGSLSHPNIVTIYDVGITEGIAYIAMEYVRGHHLSEFATAERLLPIATVVDLVARAADALDHAHRHNIVHRDIKPANIMYDWISNNLKITDFGIAKLIDANRTRTGIVLGTPAYMSPEQLEGRNVNGHTDLFALGVSLYQLLTGQLPFRGASMTNLMFVIANEPHESVTRLRADLPKSLDAIVDRALAKDPADRFRCGAEMAAALRRAA
jgi:hypothetical protein